MKQGIQSRKKHRYLITLLAAALVAAVVFPVGGKIARAEGSYKLTVKGGSETDIADLEKANMRIDIYKIADGSKDATYDTWHWTLTEDYKDLKFDEKTIDNAGYSQLAQDAANIAIEKGITPITPTNSSGDSFSGLEPGLYVILPRDKEAEKDSDIIKNGDNVQTVVNSSEWTYRYNPSITAIPSKDAQGGISGKKPGTNGTAADYGPWRDSVEVVLKPSISPRLGSLEIVKTLRTFETKDPATFVFSIDAVDKNGKNVYSDVVSMTFTGAGQESREINDIPVGAEVTVTEKYSGASYQAESVEPQKKTISAETVTSVNFTNDYDHTYHGGGGIENRFNYQTPESESGEPWYFTQVVNGEVVE